MNKTAKVILNLILIPLFVYAVYLFIEIPQVYGKLALGILIATLSFNLFKKKLIAIPVYALGFVGAGLILFSAYSFNAYTERERSKFDIPTAVSFEKTDFNTALLKAKEANKPLFIDFYTGWCAPCLVFTKNVLTDQEVGEFMNDAFVNLKYDAEKGEGIKIAKKYKVTSYPTLLIIDSDGNLLERIGDQWVPKKEDMIAVSKKYNNQ